MLKSIRRRLMALDKNYLPYEEFATLSLFDKHEVFEGITIRRFPTKIGLYFEAQMKKGSKVIEHYHNSIEYFKIRKGKIRVNGKIEYGEGDELVFDPFEVHKLEVLEDCTLYVQFIKENVNTKKTYKVTN